MVRQDVVDLFVQSKNKVRCTIILILMDILSLHCIMIDMIHIYVQYVKQTAVVWI